ncbi:hypothetical protein SAMN05216188_10867 [Lentzea xinjiangensis]|uniref:Uncharacterized protein n=1 Tax=Lentzea xinjiangensis TaxID=402600 RepID=A0A1H9LS04_9PSEU|nr:hypothetical protein [Lentzea xinjiangensis]SER14098.1 hypothetical protein SAMN05216188_10867 [Lentzea xinjiangensis]
MKRLVTTTIATLATTTFLATTTTTTAGALAATGRVAVFSTEATPIEIFENPSGCNKLAPDAHVLVNLTDSDVIVHGDPLCLGPGLVVGKEHGSHVAAGSGAFSVKD